MADTRNYRSGRRNAGGRYTQSSSRGSSSDSSYLRMLYQYSSEAHELAPEPYEDIPQARPAKKKKPVQKKRVQQTQKTQRVQRKSDSQRRYERYQKAKIRERAIKRSYMPKFVNGEKSASKTISPTVIGTLFIIFVGIFFYIWSTGYVTQKEIELKNMRNTLAAAQKSNLEARSQIYKGYDLDFIERYATSKLGMVKPEEHNKIYISVQKESYFASTGASEVTQSDQQTMSLLDLIMADLFR